VSSARILSVTDISVTNISCHQFENLLMFDCFMKTRGLTASIALAGFLVASGGLASADEPRLVPVTTALSSTVISGYVSVAAEYNSPAQHQPGGHVQAPTPQQPQFQIQPYTGRWLWTFLYCFRFHF
jgi:hypothetical protein